MESDYISYRLDLELQLSRVGRGELATRRQSGGGGSLMTQTGEALSPPSQADVSLSSAAATPSSGGFRVVSSP